MGPNQYSSRRDGEVYIRSFTFARDVPIRIDYSAKFVDLAHGAVPGILAGLTSLNCSELTLKKVHYRNGISGMYFQHKRATNLPFFDDQILFRLSTEDFKLSKDLNLPLFQSNHRCVTGVLGGQIPP